MKVPARGFDFQVSQDDESVAYLRLPGHPGPGAVGRTVTLRQLIKDYVGPDVNLDFDESNILIGIEIVG